MTDKKYPSQTLDKFMLRFPEGMRESIKEAADSNGRSMNTEIVRRLSGSFEGAKGETEDLASQAIALNKQLQIVLLRMKVNASQDK